MENEIHSIQIVSILSATMEYSYNPQDLEANGVLKQSGHPGICDLNNDVHPIWRREIFRMGDIKEQVRLLERNDSSWDRSIDRVEETYYQRMKHGLQLATLLLQESGPFFSQLLYGKLEGRQVSRLHPLGPFEEWRMREVNVVSNPRFSASVIANQLETFTKHVAESSRIYLPGYNRRTDAWGETRVTYNDRCRYAIGIGSVLADVFCTPQWHKVNAQTRRFFNFQLALTLVHELAHVAWRCRRWNDILDNPDEEDEEAILFPSEEQVEIGQSWEIWFFGGELRPIDTYENPPRWLGFTCGEFTSDSGNKDSLAYRDCRYGGRAVPAASINQFFQRKRWAAYKDGTQPFSVEQTPVSSLAGESADGDIAAGFMARLMLNHEDKGGSRPPFPVEP